MSSASSNLNPSSGSPRGLFYKITPPKEILTTKGTPVNIEFDLSSQRFSEENTKVFSEILTIPKLEFDVNLGSSTMSGASIALLTQTLKTSPPSGKLSLYLSRLENGELVDELQQTIRERNRAYENIQSPPRLE